MAKPLGAKSRLIRAALAAHPNMGNTELAALLNADPERKKDGIEVKALDVAAQKQALKRAAEGGDAEHEEDNGAEDFAVPPLQSAPAVAHRPASTPRAVPTPPAKASESPLDLVERVFDLAKECGGFNALKRLVDRCAELERR